MFCEILVKQTESGFIAAVLGLPDCVAEAIDREEAIAKVKAKAQSWTTTGEFVQIGDNHTQSKVGFGIFADQQMFDEFTAALKQVRAEIDANPNQP
ncbi:MAG: type II toxin-antitoxin system HicB family antitoxin [Blastocatellia bacterium]